MTDELFDQRLRAWYRAEVGTDEVAPADLRQAVMDIPAAPRSSGRPAIRWTLLAAAALLAIVSIAGVLVGGSLITRVRPVATPRPTSVAPAIAPPTPAPTPSPTPGPTPTASPVPIPPLIAAYHALGDTAEILTIDPQTGAQVRVGTMPIALQPTGANVFADTFGPGFVGVRWSTDRRLITVSNVTDGTYPRAQFDVVTNEIAPIDLRDQAYVSPDGRFFAILGYDPSTVRVVDRAGDVVHQIDLPAGTYFSELSWTPDGSAVLAAGAIPGPGAMVNDGVGDGQVFAATDLGPVTGLIVPINGDPIQRFGGSAALEIVVGRMSPDMTTIVAPSFCGSEAPPGCVNGLVQIDVKSAKISQLTTDIDDTDPQWSPDGSRIAFVRWSGPDRGVWVMNADGSNATKLTTPDRRKLDHDIAWAPDGSAILFTRGNVTQTRLGDLYMTPSTGGDMQLLLSDAVGDW